MASLVKGYSHENLPYIAFSLAALTSFYPCCGFLSLLFVLMSDSLNSHHNTASVMTTQMQLCKSGLGSPQLV